jgi:hypothetical protein
MRFPPKLKTFVDELQWTIAKTYASTWPHEYVVRGRVNEELFIQPSAAVAGELRKLAGAVGAHEPAPPRTASKATGSKGYIGRRRCR